METEVDSLARAINEIDQLDDVCVFILFKYYLIS